MRNRSSAKARDVAADESISHQILNDLEARFRGPLKTYFGKREPNSADIDDLVQDVFVRLAARPDISEIDQIEGYIFATAANVFRDRLRRRATRRVHHHEQYDDGAHGADTICPERVVLGKDALDRLTEALAELPERTRRVYVLRRFEGLKNAQIAEHLNLSVSGVRFHLVKAKAHLVTRLEEKS